MKETYKIETFVPIEALEQIKNGLYEKGFGKIGNYENCLSWYKVDSSWKPVDGANPYQGTVGETEFATEYKICASFSHLILSGLAFTLLSVFNNINRFL